MVINPPKKVPQARLFWINELITLNTYPGIGIVPLAGLLVLAINETT